MVHARRIIRLTRTIPEAGRPHAVRADDLADELEPLLVAEKAAFARRCHDRQISMAHLFVMVMVDRYGPLPMTRVAELVGSGLPTATGLISRMEDRGFVRREHDQRDRRVVLVHLTEEGADELSALHAARRRRILAAAAKLSDEELRQLQDSIRILRDAFDRVDLEVAAG
jgi:DNA-binding MarR family transcriptional regulator